MITDNNTSRCAIASSKICMTLHAKGRTRQRLMPETSSLRTSCACDAALLKIWTHLRDHKLASNAVLVDRIISERERVGTPTAEGATAPETLRHPDRPPINTLESGAAAPAEGVSHRRLKRRRPSSQANDRGGMHAVHALLPGAIDEHPTLTVGLDPIVVRLLNVIRYIRSGPSLSAQSSTRC